MRVITIAVLTCLLASGCAQNEVKDAGSKITVGPTLLATPTAGPGIPTATPTAAPSTAATPGSPGATGPAVSADGPIRTLPQMRQLLLNAIHYKGRKGNPALTVQRRKYAQYQFIVTWQVSNDPADAKAKQLAAYDAVRVLRFIQKADLPAYGSVLLLIYARVPDAKGGSITSQVVRAKYTANAVKTANFTTAQVWKQTDDKPAEVHVRFR